MALTLSEITVVVIPLAGRAALERTLAALELQQPAPPGEILVVHRPFGANDATLAARFPKARFLEEEGNVPARRSRGLREARGGVIALLEDSCVPAAGWARSLLDAHAGGEAAVGGPIIPSPGLDAVSLAGCLVEFGGFLPRRIIDPEEPGAAGDAASDAAPRPVSSLPGCNISYARSFLERERDLWERELFEIRLHARCRETGVPLLIAPGARVIFGMRSPLGKLLGERFHHGRLYGGEVRRAGALRAALRAAAAPAIFGVLAARLLWSAAGPSWRLARPWASTPPALLALGSWSAGEAAGCLAGPGRSGERWG